LRDRVSRDQPLLGQVALVTGGAAQCDPALATRLAAQGAAVAMGNASGPGTVLDEIAATYGGLDLGYVAGADDTWRSAIAELLQHSPVGGRIVTVEAPAMPPVQ
jgi:NAD(P)-dependent dehydrogenase (short-subunit alcohol dehydrogenase family)